MTYKWIRTAIYLLPLATWMVVNNAHGEAPEMPSAAQNWPQWRGPLGTGVSPDAHPPIQWSEEKNIQWKVAIPGAGSATPIVWGDKIFIQTAIATGKKAEPPAEASPSAAIAPRRSRTIVLTAASDAPATAPSSIAPSAQQSTPPSKSSGAAAGGKGGRGGMMMGPKPDEYYQFVLLCLDRRTGSELWRKVAREEVPHEGFRPNDGSFASASPVTDGQRVYAYFGSRGLYCFDMQGNKLWDKDFGKMQIKLSFGEGSSPALYGNAIIVNWDHEGQSFITALDKQTGNELWRTPRDEKTSWATPLVVSLDGKLQVITAATSKIRSYDLNTGKLIWECAGLGANAIPSPVAADGVAYVTTGFRGSILLAIRLDQTGDLSASDAILWKYDKDTPYVPSPLLYDGKLYIFKVNTNVLTCLDAKTGKPLYGPQRVEGLGDVYASPAGADGRIYLVSRNGTTVVIRSGDKLEVLATNKLDEGIDASPAVAGNDLFLRGKEHLYCISEK